MAQRRESALTRPEAAVPVNGDDRIQGEDDVEDQGGVEEVPLDVLVSVTGVGDGGQARSGPGWARPR
jgi:hypothetical protein